MQSKLSYILPIFFILLCGCQNEESAKEGEQGNTKPKLNISLAVVFQEPFPKKENKDTLFSQLTFRYYITTASYDEITINWKPANNFKESDLRLNDTLTSGVFLINVQGLRHHKPWKEGYSMKHKRTWRKFYFDILCFYSIPDGSEENLKEQIYDLIEAGYYGFTSEKFDVTFSKDTVRVIE